MKKLTFLLLMLTFGQSWGATYYVDAAQVKYITWTGLWAYLQPSAEWRLADGVTYDKTAGIYDNYGSTILVAGLTDVNAPSLSEGILSAGQSGLYFDGVNDGLQDATATELDVTTGNFSIAIWARNGTNNDDRIAKKRGANAGWILQYVDATNTIEIYIQDAAGDDAYCDVASTPGAWEYIVATWDGTLKKADLYVNGSLNTATNTDALVGSITNTAAFTVSQAGQLFDGDIALVQFWTDRILSTTAVDSLYLAMLPTGSSALPYPNLQTAAYQGSAGDTILLAAGTYRETVSISKAFDYIGASDTRFGGWPVIHGRDIPAAGGTVGITISADNEIGFLEIRGYTAAQGLLATSTSDGSLFHHLVIDSCLNGVDFDGACSGDSLINCTIDGAGLAASTGFRATTSTAITVVMLNGIVANCETGITKAEAQTLTGNYNDVWNCTTPYSGTTAGANDLAVRPQFRGGNDYRPYNTWLRRGIEIHIAAGAFGQTYIGAWDVISNGRSGWTGGWTAGWERVTWKGGW